LPYLIDGDVKLTESKAILKYIARKHDKRLLGKDEIEFGIAEMLSRIHDQIESELANHSYRLGDSDDLQHFIDQKATQLDTFLGSRQFFVGDNVTYVDFCMFELLDYMNFLTKTGRVFQKHPRLQAFWTRVERLPRFCDFWANPDKCRKAPFNNKHAKINN
jgi:glutathione S-transferase